LQRILRCSLGMGSHVKRALPIITKGKNTQRKIMELNSILLPPKILVLYVLSGFWP